MTFNQEYKLEGTLVLLHFIFFDFTFFISVSYFKIILIGRSLKFSSWRHTLPSFDSLVQFQVMKTAIIITIFLINICMSKKNLTDVDDKKENQNGTDNSTYNFQIEEGQYTFFGCKL